jgi:hypothetical protein
MDGEQELEVLTLPFVRRAGRTTRIKTPLSPLFKYKDSYSDLKHTKINEQI